MAFGDYVKAVLAGGLPAVLDYGSGAGNRQGDTRPEATAPNGTIQDKEPFLNRDSLSLETGVLVLVGVAALVGLIVIVARR